MHFTLPESWTRTKSIQTGVRGFPALKLLPIQVCWPLGLARLEFALALFTRRRWGLKDCSASLHLSADLIRLPLLLQPQDLVGLERTGSQSLCPSPPPPFFFLSLSPSLLLSLSISVLSISMPRPVPWSLSQRGTDQLGGSGGSAAQALPRGAGRSSHSRQKPQPLASSEASARALPPALPSTLSGSSQARLPSQTGFTTGGTRPGARQIPRDARVFPHCRQRPEQSASWDPGHSAFPSQGLCRGWSWCSGGQAWGILESCGAQPWGKAATSWAPLDPAGKGRIS